MDMTESMESLAENLTDWHWSQLRGFPKEGIRCLIQLWMLLKHNHLIQGTAFRICAANGTWLWGNNTNYSQCDETFGTEDQGLRVAVAYVYFLGSIISVTCLAIALSIFTFFRSIRCDRIQIHIHFMWALALKCVTFIIMTEPIVVGRSNEHPQENWICKLLLGSQIYASLASVNWMFVQGHYLNSKLTTNIFGRKFPIKIYIALGWGMSLATFGTWFALMESFYSEGFCWDGYTESKLIWVIVGPMLCVLLGMLVSIFYCFSCLDVRRAIRRHWDRFSATRDFTSDRNYPQRPAALTSL